MKSNDTRCFQCACLHVCVRVRICVLSKAKEIVEICRSVVPCMTQGHFPVCCPKTPSLSLDVFSSNSTPLLQRPCYKAWAYGLYMIQYKTSQ